MNFESKIKLVNVLFLMALTVLSYRNYKTCKYIWIYLIYFLLFRVFLKNYGKAMKGEEHIQEYCLYYKIAQILHATCLP